MIHKPELLAPAGDMEKLEAAVRFGADAVYVGAGEYSLRAAQTSFSLSALKKGVAFAHKHKVKVYLALNIFPFDEDLPKMMKYLKSAIKLGIDAVIISDPGLIHLIKQTKTKIKIHLSTQANTLNAEAVKFWRKQGGKRIVLGRELSLAQVKKIKKAVPSMEIELFVHGAMCMSYSGRCLLSKFMIGRSANRGECAHPCRWEYFLKEKERPEEEFSIEQDQRGTYVMNSRDLCMVEHIPELIKAGVDSFKIEGRMKSVYYVALVTKIYREAVNEYLRSPKKFRFDPRWQKELAKVSHRTYTTGFYFGADDRENITAGATVRNYSFVGVVVGHKNSQLEIKVRNYFTLNDELEIIDPNYKEIMKFKVKEIVTKEGEQVSAAHNPYHVFVPIDLSSKVSCLSFLRRKR